MPLFYISFKISKKVRAYFVDYLESCRKTREEYEKNSPPGVVRLRQLKRERNSTNTKLT